MKFSILYYTASNNPNSDTTIKMQLFYLMLFFWYAGVFNVTLDLIGERWDTNYNSKNKQLVKNIQNAVALLFKILNNQNFFKAS